jgi:hypothetical protein
VAGLASGKAAFAWVPHALARRLSTPEATPELLEAHRREIARSFVETVDGRCAPSPRFIGLSARGEPVS